jgi:hypothetical protein
MGRVVVIQIAAAARSIREQDLVSAGWNDMQVHVAVSIPRHRDAEKAGSDANPMGAGL